jgi:hypothetical protein
MTMEASKRFDEALLSLAWSLWAELGVSSVARNHRGFAVDPEALLLFTAPLGKLDPRLRDEAMDCTLNLAPYFWIGRLKNLLRDSSKATLEAFSSAAFTFNANTTSAVSLPSTEDGKPWHFRSGGKWRLERFDEASQIYLRLRAVFGVGARADALTIILCAPRFGWLASELSEYVGLAKRVMADVLVDFDRAGMMRAAKVGNRLRYDLVRADPLQRLAGALPRWRPWAVTLPFFLSVRTLLQESSGRREVAILVDAQKIVMVCVERLVRLGFHASVPVFKSWTEQMSWLVGEVEAAAKGSPMLLGVDPDTSGVRRTAR